MSTATEPAIEMASRHVRKGEELIERQIELIAKLRRSNHPTEEAERILKEFRSIQALHIAELETLTISD